jgi:hypothetical protein
MKKYYLHDGSDNIGPFDIEELKAHKISRTTKIWFDGIEEWQNADEIEELKMIFTSIPPPIKPVSTPPPININPTVDKSVKILGLRKKTFFIVVVASVLIFSLIIKLIHNYKIDKVERDNIETNIYNEQLKIQNAEIEKQNEIIAEKERLEQERIQKEKKIALEKRIQEILEEMNIANNELAKANNKLVDVTGFKLLRTSSEREQQISIAQEDISIWEYEIEKIDKEMIRINPNWGE